MEASRRGRREYYKRGKQGRKTGGVRMNAAVMRLLVE
jgi:hypothetical protein